MGEIVTGLRQSKEGIRPPSPWLAPFVIGYVADEGDQARQVRCVPDCRIVMAVSFDARQSDVKGLHDRPQLVSLPVRPSTAAVLLTPWGARALFGTGMHELANVHTNLPALLGRAADRLSEQLAEAPSWEARYSLLDQTLSHLLADHQVGWIVHAWQRLTASGGTVRVEELAADVGWSPRRLQVHFRDQIGLPPKTMARIIRLHRAVRLLVRGDRRASDVAAECGYWDQAHLNRDFRALTGCTPTELVGALKPAHAF
jgi:AraC-like DNA-binding protein